MNRRELLKKAALGAGIVLTPTALTVIMNSCSSKPSINWTPKVFTQNQALTVRGLVDMIMPKTDTPGAIELNVDRFIDLLIDVTYDTYEKKEFTEELDNFQAKCLEKNNTLFQDCSLSEKQEILNELEANSGKFSSEIWGKPIEEQEPLNFYRKLKAMAITGYYSSEEVGKNILSYDPVPGAYLECIPVSEVGNAWTEG